jgi:hypothetical protein
MPVSDMRQGSFQIDTEITLSDSANTHHIILLIESKQTHLNQVTSNTMKLILSILSALACTQVAFGLERVRFRRGQR